MVAYFFSKLMVPNRADISYDLNLEPMKTSHMPLTTEATCWSSGIAAENIDVGYTYIRPAQFSGWSSSWPILTSTIQHTVLW